MTSPQKWTLVYEESDPVLRVDMQPGGALTAESGAMVAMSPSMSIRGHAKGGVKKAMSRMFLGGESFFQSTISCEAQPGHVLLAPKMPGHIKIIQVQQGDDWKLASGAFLACEETVQTGSESQKVGGGLFSGAGFFIFHATGFGQLAVNAYGKIHEVTLSAGEQYVVDNNHLVAWTATYVVEKASSGIMSSMKSGEGLVLRFTGPGVINMQTRNMEHLASCLRPYFPQK